MKILKKDIEVLNGLLKNARMSFTQLSKETGLADTTIHFRARKLAEEGIIKQYTVDLDLDKLGVMHKALLIFRIKKHTIEELAKRRARDFIEILKNDKKIGFLARAKDELTLVALLVSSDVDSFNNIIDKFHKNADIEEIKVIPLGEIEKQFIHML